LGQFSKAEANMTLEVEADYAVVARNELRTQRQRNSYFSNSQIFGDPAWEIVFEGSERADHLFGALLPALSITRAFISDQRQALVGS
jgi:hypothetical protein